MIVAGIRYLYMYFGMYLCINARLEGAFTISKHNLSETPKEEMRE